MRFFPALIVFVVALLCPAMALADASSCKQQDAVYSDEDQAFELAFTSPEQETALATNTFTLTMRQSKTEYKGWVIWNNGVARPNGVLTLNCPGGDITGEELDACKIWDGVVYSVFSDGQVDLLPPGDDPAAEGLLFPDLGRTLRYSATWDDNATVPWDVFKFVECRK